MEVVLSANSRMVNIVIVYLDSTMFMSGPIFVPCFPPQSSHGFTLAVIHDSCTPLTAFSEVTEAFDLESFLVESKLTSR